MNILFQGDISKNITLMEIFQTLNNKEQKGWLIVKQSGEELRLYFENHKVGLVTVTSPHREFIAEKLMYAGKITSQNYEACLKQGREECLKSLRQIVPEEADRLSGMIAYDQMCTILAMGEGHFRFVLFDAEDMSSLGSPPTAMFDIGGILMEAARRGDELPQIRAELPQHHEILFHNTQQLPAKYEKDQAMMYIWKFADKRSIRSTILCASTSDFDAHKRLATLYQGKYLRLMTDEEMMTRVRSLDGKADISEALEICEAILKRDPNNAAGWKALLEASLKYKDRGEAFPALICDCLDLIAIDAADTEKQKKLRDVANALVHWQQLDRARSILDRLCTVNPEDVKVRTELIQLYRDLKDTPGAVSEYEKLADYHERKGEWKKVKPCYQAILKLSPNRRDISKKLEELKKRRQAIKFPEKKIIWGVGVAVLALVLGWGIWPTTEAILEDHGTRHAINEHIQNQKWQEAKKLAKTLPLEEQSKILKSITEMEVEVDRKNSQAGELIVKAREQEKSGRLRQALKTFEDAGRLARNPEIAQNASRLTRILEDFDRNIAKAKKLENAPEQEKKEQAMAIYIALWQDQRYKNFPDRHQIKLPLCLKVSPVGANAIVELPPEEYYFEMQADEAEGDGISEKLRNSLADIGFLLSPNAVREITSEDLWQIHDREKGEKYRIRRSGSIWRVEAIEKSLDREDVQFSCPPNFRLLKVWMTGYEPRHYSNAFFGETPPVSQQTLVPLFTACSTLKLPKYIVHRYAMGKGIAEGNPCVGEDALYIACSDGYLYAFAGLHSDNQTFLWKEEICSRGFSGGPSYCRGTLYIAGKDDCLYAVNSKIARITGQSRLSAPIISSPAISLRGSKVICATDTEIYSFPLIEGDSYRAEWSGTLLFKGSLAGAPVIVEDKIAAITQEGNLTLLNFNGKVLWKCPIERRDSCSLATSEGIVYLQTSTHVTAVDIEGKSQLWQKKISPTSFKHLMVSRNKLYCVTDDRIYVFSADKNARLHWEYEEKDGQFNTFPGVNDREVLYIGSRKQMSQMLYAIDRGNLLWKFEFPQIGETISSPVLVGNWLFVVSRMLYTLYDN